MSRFNNNFLKERERFLVRAGQGHIPCAGNLTEKHYAPSRQLYMMMMIIIIMMMIIIIMIMIIIIMIMIIYIIPTTDAPTVRRFVGPETN